MNDDLRFWLGFLTTYAGMMVFVAGLMTLTLPTMVELPVLRSIAMIGWGGVGMDIGACLLLRRPLF